VKELDKMAELHRFFVRILKMQINQRLEFTPAFFSHLEWVGSHLCVLFLTEQSKEYVR